MFKHSYKLRKSFDIFFQENLLKTCHTDCVKQKINLIINSFKLGDSYLVVMALSMWIKKIRIYLQKTCLKTSLFSFVMLVAFLKNWENTLSISKIRKKYSNLPYILSRLCHRVHLTKWWNNSVSLKQIFLQSQRFAKITELTVFTFKMILAPSFLPFFMLSWCSNFHIVAHITSIDCNHCTTQKTKQKQFFRQHFSTLSDDFLYPLYKELFALSAQWDGRRTKHSKIAINPVPKFLDWNFFADWISGINWQCLESFDYLYCLKSFWNPHVSLHHRRKKKNKKNYYCTLNNVSNCVKRKSQCWIRLNGTFTSAFVLLYLSSTLWDWTCFGQTRKTLRRKKLQSLKVSK